MEDDNMSNNTNRRCVDCQQLLPDNYTFTRHLNWQECLDALSARYTPIEAENTTLRARVAKLEQQLLAAQIALDDALDDPHDW
jgi:hypothetical protein